MKNNEISVYIIHLIGTLVKHDLVLKLKYGKKKIADHRIT